uniref:Receptor for retinol uptake STRA6 n=1 Tax=Amazona collaria TaxID=241587 RepID=A0A8B9GCS6_9PSIT
MFPSVIPDCDPTISPRLYHICMAPISVSTCHIPWDELFALMLYLLPPSLGHAHLLPYTRFGLFSLSNSGLVAAVFGILFSSLCVLVLDTDPLPLITHSSQRGVKLWYWKILALLYYPAFYYPLIACATVRHRASYLMGCLLSWCHCVLHIWQKVDCPQSPKIYRYYSTLSYIPIILGLVLLSLWYPALLIKTPLQFFLTGFRIPLKLILSITTAMIAVYQVALLLLVAVVPTIQIIRAGMTKDIVVLLVQFGLVPSESPAAPGDMEKELRTVKYYLWSLEVCYICSLVLCCLLTCAMLLRTLVMHRSNLKALYQGAVLDVFYKAHILRPSRQAIVCWMSFASFQTAFTCLGLLIQQVIFFICSAGFAGGFCCLEWCLMLGALLLASSLPPRPFWLTLVVAVIAQNLAAHYQFLEQHPLRKELTNRRALYIATYLLFPTNVLVGVLAGLWRMLISGLYNSIHFCQLDISLLNRGVETFDPGYHAYCHYLKIEVSQSHPVMKAFCLLLLQLARPEGPLGLQPSNMEEGIQLMQHKQVPPSRARFKQSRARWWLAYTLLNNPSLAACRKTALCDPKANGTQLSTPEP